MQTPIVPTGARSKATCRRRHRGIVRRTLAAGLPLCLLGACVLLLAPARHRVGSDPLAAGLLAAPVMSAPPSAPAPSVTMARRRTATSGSGDAALTITPATIPAAGGRVRLRARVRAALRCRFASAEPIRKLPSIRSCVSGRASITVRLPRNRTSARRKYVLLLTVSGKGGVRRTVREVIVERARRGAASGAGSANDSGETAASGVRTKAVGSPASTSADDGSLAELRSAPRTASVPPVVTTQPTNETVGAGTQVTLNAAAAGSPAPSVQWQVSTTASAGWASTVPSFIASAAQSGNEYRAVFTSPAGSTKSNVVTLTVLPTTTDNFSGYIDYAAAGESFTAVSGSWTVPTVTCQPGATTWAAQWPGIGDATSVEQDGTETDCFGGTPDYWAWYEMYGDAAVNDGYAVPLPAASYPVVPGDEMTGSVSFSGSTWELALADATQNWTFSTQIASPTPALSQGSAEWLVEDPDGCTPQCQTLSQFSPVQFSGATATANGESGPISSFPATAVALDQGSTLLAAPGLLDSTGAGFTDTWLAG